MSDIRGFPTFSEWRSTLPAADGARADELIELLRSAGADEPESWARSEVSENIPQAARYSFLRAVWRHLERWRNPEVIDRVLKEHDVPLEQRDQLRRLIGEVAFEIAGSVVYVVDAGADDEGDDRMPGWVLMETDPDGTQTGRSVVGLHESLMEVDPLGIEAEDIRGF